MAQSSYATWHTKKIKNIWFFFVEISLHPIQFTIFRIRFMCNLLIHSIQSNPWTFSMFRPPKTLVSHFYGIPKFTSPFTLTFPFLSHNFHLTRFQTVVHFKRPTNHRNSLKNNFFYELNFLTWIFKWLIFLI